MFLIARFLLLLLLALPAAAQQQRPEDPNAAYRTREGREQIATSLDSPARAERMRARDLVGMLKLKPGDNVADIGTGTGMMVPFLSQAVGPTGRVYAEDIFPDFLEKVRDKIQKDSLSNVTLALGAEKSPMLPRGQVAVAVIVDAYHHFEFPKEMLGGIRDALGPSGRLVVVDFYKTEGPSPGHIRKDRDEVVREIEQNGFKLEASAELTKQQYVLTFARHEASPR